MVRGTHSKGVFAQLKSEYDRTLIELLDLTQRYNSLLDDYQKLRYDCTKIAERNQCRNICHIVAIPRRYNGRAKYCSQCATGIPNQYQLCPCCRLRLRTVRRNK